MPAHASTAGPAALPPGARGARRRGLAAPLTAMAVLAAAALLRRSGEASPPDVAASPPSPTAGEAGASVPRDADARAPRHTWVRWWRAASIPVAALAVVATLFLIQRAGEAPPPGAEASDPAAADPARASSAGGHDAMPPGDHAPGTASFVRDSSFSLAMPAGWERTSPAAGASFAAAASGGGADASLWIEQDPGLDFPTFISRSLEQLRAVAGSAEVTERIPASTPDASVVRLAAQAPSGGPSYEVTLRAAGPYRYYLATTVESGAGSAATEGAELIHGSFTPETAAEQAP